jgi:type VII secretion protein EssB
MEEILCCTIKNSDLNVPKEKRLFLIYPASGLCPCTLEEREDGIVLNFNADGMFPAQMVQNKSRADKLRFLINLSELEYLHKDYTFSMSPDNLLTDLNLRPHILSRDLNNGDTTLMQKYKAVIGQLLAPRYSYADYLNGGGDLYKKQKLLSKIGELETVADVREYLESEYDETIKKTAETKKLVSKQSVTLSRILIPVLTVSLAIVSFFSVRAIFIDIPHQSRIIEASQFFIARDYVAVQNALHDVSLTDMTYETKHLLAYSYVITEALSDEQKEHILAGLTRMTYSVLFDFWIHLGRLEFDESIEIAQLYRDSDLLYFTYIKKREYVQTDISLPGDERTALLDHLDREITRLQNERTLEE